MVMQSLVHRILHLAYVVGMACSLQHKGEVRWACALLRQGASVHRALLSTILDLGNRLRGNCGRENKGRAGGGSRGNGVNNACMDGRMDGQMHGWVYGELSE